MSSQVLIEEQPNYIGLARRTSTLQLATSPGWLIEEQDDHIGLNVTFP
jgi:hypothetical protein